MFLTKSNSNEFCGISYIIISTTATCIIVPQHFRSGWRHTSSLVLAWQSPLSQPPRLNDMMCTAATRVSRSISMRLLSACPSCLVLVERSWLMRLVVCFHPGCVVLCRSAKPMSLSWKKNTSAILTLWRHEGSMHTYSVCAHTHTHTHALKHSTAFLPHAHTHPHTHTHLQLIVSYRAKWGRSFFTLARCGGVIHDAKAEINENIIQTAQWSREEGLYPHAHLPVKESCPKRRRRAAS